MEKKRKFGREREERWKGKRGKRGNIVEKEKEKIFWWRRRSNLGEGGNRFGVKGEAIL